MAEQVVVILCIEPDAEPYYIVFCAISILANAWSRKAVIFRGCGCRHLWRARTSRCQVLGDNSRGSRGD